MVWFGVLGPLLIRRGDLTVRLPRPGLRRMLGVLLLTPGRPVGEQRLAQLVWGPGEASASAIHTAVSRLRSWLADEMCLPDAIVRCPAGYEIRVPDEAVDVMRFRGLTGSAGVAELRAALVLWRGAVLADAAERLRDDPVVVALEEQRAACAYQLADLATAAGTPAVAIGELDRLAADRPYDEVLQARLILLLVAAGRRAAALNRYRRTSQRLAEELGVDPSPPLREARRVLHGGGAGPATHGVVVPAELPSDLPTFAGRSAQLRQIRALLQAGDQPAVVVVDGPAGVGKSTLAVHAAHQAAGRFPDGQLYVDLGGAGAHPRHPNDVVGRFLRALGVAGPDVPTDPAEANRRYRSLTADRRLLVVLDNARDVTQVAPLLPSGGCAALVTSRSTLGPLDAGTRVHLDVMGHDEAVGLLTRLLGAERVAAEPGAARHIATLCGGLPLALRIAGGRLAHRPNWTLRLVADRLVDARRRLDELRLGDLDMRASFQVSYQSLLDGRDPRDRAAARAFRLLGLFQGNLDAPTAARLLDMPAARAGPILGRLVDVHLVDRDHAGRYRLHDLIRLFAREQAGMDETVPRRRAAVRRLLDCYLATARRASALAYPAARRRCGHDVPPTGRRAPAIPVATRAEAVDWLDSERDNLLAAAQQAAEDPHTATVAVALASVLYTPFDLRAHWSPLLQLQKLAVDAARRLGDRSRLAEAHSDMGFIHGRLGQCDRGFRHLRHALVLWRDIDDPLGEGRAHTELAGLYVQERRFDLAAAHYRRGLRILRTTPDRARVAQCLNNMGRSLCRQGRYREAIAAGEEAVTINRELGRRYGEMIAVNNLAEAHRRHGHPDRAAGLFERAIAIAGDLGSVYDEAEAWWGLGHVRHALGDVDRARASWRRSLATLEDIGAVSAAEVRRLLASEVPADPDVIRVNR